MKYVKLTLFAFLVLYAQILLIPSIGFFNNYLNIILPFVILLSVKSHENFALIITFLIGLLYDVLYQLTFGLNGMIFLIISFVLINYKSYFNFNQFLITLLISFAVNILYYITLFLFYLFSGEKNTLLSVSFLLSVALNTIFTTLLFFVYSFLIKLKLIVANEQ